MSELLSPAQAAARIPAGATVGLGGLQGNFPMATIRALARGGVKDLSVVGGQIYSAQREDAMHLFALQDSVLEIEFEDDIIAEH